MIALTKFMIKYKYLFLAILALAFMLVSFSDQKNSAFDRASAIADSIKVAKKVDSLVPKLTFYKKTAHASYYADKFNGRRTASGRKFDNNKYTAAHRKFPFGTMLRITNENSGISVDVEVIDRGPFTKGREIDLSKKAFMDIALNKGRGSLPVTIYVIEKPTK